MLITTKNTFITIEDSQCWNAQDKRSRSRCDSCPPEFYSLNFDNDSLSTVPTQGSPASKYHEEPRLSQLSAFIRNVPSGTTLEAVAEMLLIRGISVPLNDMKFGPCQSRSTCSIEITPSLPHHAMSLFQLFHGELLGGNELSVDLVELADMDKRRGILSTKKLFVGGLRPQTDTKALRRYFATFGGIVDCGVVSDFKGISKRFGFCEFDHEDSLAAVMDVGKHYIQGHGVAIRPYTARN